MSDTPDSASVIEDIRRMVDTLKEQSFRGPLYALSVDGGQTWISVDGSLIGDDTAKRKILETLMKS